MSRAHVQNMYLPRNEDLNMLSVNFSSQSKIFNFSNTFRIFIIARPDQILPVLFSRRSRPPPAEIWRPPGHAFFRPSSSRPSRRSFPWRIHRNLDSLEVCGLDHRLTQVGCPNSPYHLFQVQLSGHYY